MTTRGRLTPIAEVEFSTVAPDYYSALIGLGATNEARAERLGVSVRSIIDYKQGKALPRGSALIRCPELLAAYAANAEAINAYRQRKVAA
jgi:hypothetical protein